MLDRIFKGRKHQGNFTSKYFNTAKLSVVEFTVSILGPVIRSFFSILYDSHLVGREVGSLPGDSEVPGASPWRVLCLDGSQKFSPHRKRLRIVREGIVQDSNPIEMSRKNCFIFCCTSFIQTSQNICISSIFIEYVSNIYIYIYIYICIVTGWRCALRGSGERPPDGRPQRYEAAS